MALAHHVGARQRHHLARTVARRRKNSAAQSVQPLEDSPTSNSSSHSIFDRRRWHEARA